MSLSEQDFGAFHNAVHGREPFAWQTRLLQQVVEDRGWPRLIDLPTGTGKTTCIDIALFALALDAKNEPAARWCPRRIAMVVDRRVVVEQVAQRGSKLRGALTSAATTVVREVAARLASLGEDSEQPLGVFTLRGGIPKDDGWARSPLQPLILASTVDQIGSRLLVQGYGVSPSMRPVHAGLLGNDLLLLLDEVHLSQPFAETLAQLDKLRERFRADSPVAAARFQHVFLSATPGAHHESAFRLRDAEKEVESALGKRLHASKPARYVEADGRDALHEVCAREAQKLVARHNVVAVVVNRVASAGTIAELLRKQLGDEADVQLLTGRMRPLDRDDALRSLAPRVMADRDRGSVSRKLVLVSTQAIEAGADFDFDAMVTESASLDALRQRFGRVNRLGAYAKAEGVIVHDKSVKGDDPVYGDAMAATAKWLKGQLSKKKTSIDFGVLALELPVAEELQAMLAPKKQAPVLLPAYFDLWMQSSPEPAVVPDVSLFLHGPKSGPADVQVIWRADLTEEDLTRAAEARDGSPEKNLPATIVGAVRPSSLEAVSLPFVAALRWLQGETAGDISDVEGVESPEQEELKGKLALRRQGEDSAVITPADLRPGNTIVVPAKRGGLDEYGSFNARSTAPVPDLAERAAFFARGRPMLRLHSAVIKSLGLPALTADDPAEARQALGDVDVEALEIEWKRVWLRGLLRGKGHITIDAAEPQFVLLGKRVSGEVLRGIMAGGSEAEDGNEVSTEDDDSSHGGKRVTLAQHCTDVEALARRFAHGAGLAESLVNDLALSGWLHDIGKADHRFQILLRGGSEIDYYKDSTPLAKSGMAPDAAASHRNAQRLSGYPRGTRHELQSLAMLEQHANGTRAKAKDWDLVLHLIASHHGRARPFAPVVEDGAPVQVALNSHQSNTFGSITFAETPSDHRFYRLDSLVAQRFWNLVERYGWLELCWLEAMLRLADHRASEEEQTDET